MDKYKTNTAFNKWFSAIKLGKLSVNSQKCIFDYNSYRKKLSFEAVLKLFLYAVNEEKGFCCKVLNLLSNKVE